MRPLFSLLAFGGCVDPTDCRFFGDCGRYVPAGLACGLAHEGIDHLGGSCRNPGGPWHDPALEAPSTGVVAARAEGEPCPEGTAQLRFSDHEAGSEFWATCEAAGTSDVRRHLEDQPRGAVCGLSVLDGATRTCEGKDPAPGECPEGYRLRWVVDGYLDRMDTSCNPDPGGAMKWGYEILVFCELEQGCTGEDCLSTTLEPGVLCGLHDREFGSSGSRRDHTVLLASWAAECPDDPVLQRFQSMLAASDSPPSCLDVDDGGADGCPEGLEEVCTGDWIVVCPDWGPNIIERALCWCAPPGAAQQVDDPEAGPVCD